MSEQVQSALMTIKAESRTVIILKHFADCSYQEISQILDLPGGKVRSRLYTARQLLKNELRPAGND